jgi:hypothetical protein
MSKQQFLKFALLIGVILIVGGFGYTGWKMSQNAIHVREPVPTPTPLSRPTQIQSITERQSRKLAALYLQTVKIDDQNAVNIYNVGIFDPVTQMTEKIADLILPTGASYLDYANGKLFYALRGKEIISITLTESAEKRPISKIFLTSAENRRVRGFRVVGDSLVWLDCLVEPNIIFLTKDCRLQQAYLQNDQGAKVATLLDLSSAFQSTGEKSLHEYYPTRNSVILVEFPSTPDNPPPPGSPLNPLNYYEIPLTELEIKILNKEEMNQIEDENKNTDEERCLNSSRASEFIQNDISAILVGCFPLDELESLVR